MRRLLVPLVVVGLLAGCGGGSARLSKQEFAKRADALCASYTSAVKALGQPKDFAELARFADKTVGLAQTLIDGTRKLRPPQDEQATVDRWNAQNGKTLDAIKQLGAAAKKNDKKALQAALQAGTASDKQAKQLGLQLGMAECTKS